MEYGPTLSTMLHHTKRAARYYFISFLKHDFKASITVFFVALPLCLGVALASNAPLVSGIVAGIVGGIVVPFISRSELSVSGPAAGLTAICAAAIANLGALDAFFLSVLVAGILQLLLGVFKLGGFTHFIPNAVIKGMLAAIGVLLISKQVPLLIGYDKPDFWTNEFINVVTLSHGFSRLEGFYESLNAGAFTVTVFSSLLLWLWVKKLAERVPFIPGSFVVVLAGSLLALLLNQFVPVLRLNESEFVRVPKNVLSSIRLPDFSALQGNLTIWKNAVIICFVASLETLLSIVAIDKIDPYNRVTPQNRELIAQGGANMLSGLFGGLPITAVIVRSSANAEAGGRTRLSTFAHGWWLLLAILFALPLINNIPYCVLAVLLTRTGFNLAKPQMIRSVYKQGREQFMPFIITIIAILFTDLLIGVLIGIVYALYFLIKHTYRAGYVLHQTKKGGIEHYRIELAMNVSFLNKKKFTLLLDQIPEYSEVEIVAANEGYIDLDVLEIFQDFKVKARRKHIHLKTHNLPEVETIEMH